MKKRNLFGFLHKKEEPAKTPVYGITEAQYKGIQRALEAELGAAAARQHSDAKGPSAYMKGLLYAIKLLDSVKPYEVGVQQ